MSDPGQGAVNLELRAAVEAFAAEPGQERSIDVLRHCLHGTLLLDATGSDIRWTEDGQIAAGSTIRIASTQGPDGGTALVAFTSHAELARVHWPDEQAQSLVQPAPAVLAMAVEQDSQWLYIDPAGPTCALARHELDFAVRIPRNDAVRDALSVVSDEPHRRPELIDALRAEGTFVLAADAPELEVGPLAEDTSVRLRTATLPDGRPALLVFTSGPELVARAGRDAIVVWSTGQVLDRLRSGDYAGVVVNAAGPCAAVTADELLG